jgi:predicted metal-dependent peptidase
MVGRAVQGAGAEAMAGLPTGVLDAIEKTVGTSPADLVESVEDKGDGVVDWRGALARIVGRELRVRPRLGRLPRRLPHLVGVIPGKMRLLDRPKMMAVLDTSGSVTAADLEDMAVELRQLRFRGEVVVVECDAIIHAVYTFSGSLGHVHGRGGTDLCPPFEPVFLREHRPDVLIYFTDGYGPAPVSPPSIPVFWCLTRGGIQPTTWGRVLRIRD